MVGIAVRVRTNSKQYLAREDKTEGDASWEAVIGNLLVNELNAQSSIRAANRGRSAGQTFKSGQLPPSATDEKFGILW